MTKTNKERVQSINGIPYVYEDYPYWDVIKKQMRHKREYIGKLDANGQFVPNKSFVAKQEIEKMKKQGQVKSEDLKVARNYYGATYLLDTIGEKTGIINDLKVSFPTDYTKILSLAYYLILESDSPMYRFSKWAQNHKHPFNADIPSQRISEIFSSVGEESKMNFFKSQANRRSEKEYLAYDTTSISSYSELIDHVKYGKNKDGESLPQVNLALVFGQTSMLPVYFRKLPGNITDVMTIRKLLKDIEYLNINKVKLVLDRGFFSAKNINNMFQNHYKFIIGTKSNIKFVSSLLEKTRETIKEFVNYDVDQEVYRVSSMEQWPYEEYDATGKVVRKSERRIYVHIYYNGQRAEDEKASFIKSLSDAEANLIAGDCTEAQKVLCNKYFKSKTTPIKGVKIEYNETVIKEHVKSFGYFVLLSNEIKDPSIALSIYRNKDLIEKSFGNLKNRLNMRRTAVFSSENLEGKLFVQFIALIYVSYIHKVMKDNHLYKNHTMQTLLDDLDIIERFDYPEHKYYCSEITKKQRDIYSCFGFDPPNML